MKDKLLYLTIGLFIGIVVMQWTIPSGQASGVFPVNGIVAVTSYGVVSKWCPNLAEMGGIRGQAVRVGALALRFAPLGLRPYLVQFSELGILGLIAFADRRLSHLAMPPQRMNYVVEIIIRLLADGINSHQKK